MHTDEYEISLARELEVCDGAIKKLERSLAPLTGGHGIEPARLLELHRSGELDSRPDLAGFLDPALALQNWTERRRQYADLLRTMRI